MPRRTAMSLRMAASMRLCLLLLFAYCPLALSVTIGYSRPEHLQVPTLEGAAEEERTLCARLFSNVSEGQQFSVDVLYIARNAIDGTSYSYI